MGRYHEKENVLLRAVYCERERSSRYVVLVDNTRVRSTHSDSDDHCRLDDVEAYPKAYQPLARLQNRSFNEK